MFFSKNKSDKPVALVDEINLAANPVNYNSVVDWLVGLSNEEYERVRKVANIYRTANKDAALALGVKNSPTTFINSPDDIDVVGYDLEVSVSEQKDLDKRSKQIRKSESKRKKVVVHDVNKKS